MPDILEFSKILLDMLLDSFHLFRGVVLNCSLFLFVATFRCVFITCDLDRCTILIQQNPEVFVLITFVDECDLIIQTNPYLSESPISTGCGHPGSAIQPFLLRPKPVGFQFGKSCFVHQKDQFNLLSRDLVVETTVRIVFGVV